MKTVKCIIAAEGVIINDVRVAIDPPLSVEEFAKETKLLREQPEEVDDQWLKELGGRLFQRAFTGAALDQYRSSDPSALALAVNDELAVLPWELLHDGANWTARTRGIVRVATTEQASPEIIPKSGSLRILAAIAGPLLHDDESLPDDDPRQPDPIDVKAQAEIFRELGGAQFPAEIKLRKHVTREIFSREVSENYHILHFVGHGNVGRLVFESRHGIADLAEEGWIREQVTVALRGGLRLVVVNSCFSADASGEMPGVAATILETSVSAVIAMRGSVSEPADIAFVKNLYGDLAKGKPIDESVMNARRAMATDWQIGAWEWATPVLFINDSLLEAEASLNLMDAGMAEMMSDPKVSIVEPPKPPLDPMMTRDEKFVGRRRELSDVLRSLDPDAGRMPALPAQIVCLHGDAGMGKTAIAIEAVHRMAGWFDDVIWLSGRTGPPDELREHIKGDDPLARITGAEGLLTSLAHKCGLELTGDEDPSQLRNIVLKGLNDSRRRLLVLDSMERFVRSDLIRSLLTNLPANCKALITSRESLEINEKPIHVGPMNVADSARLVIAYSALKGLEVDLKELRINSKSVDEITQRTGGNPMTMRVVVSQVATAEKTLDDALEDLREAKGEIFDYIFKRSLSLAGQNGRKVFAAMAVFLPTAGRKALQSVCGLSEAESEKAIKRVVGLSLVEQYEQGKRFGLHQLARAKAQQELESDSDAESYREAAAQFFMDFVNATAPMTKPEIAVQVLSEQMPGSVLGKQMLQDAVMEILVKPAIENLEAELANCLLSMGWMLGRGNLDMATKFCDGLGEFLMRRGYWEAATHYFLRIAEGWRNRGDRHAEAVGLLNLGTLYYSRGRWKEAMAYYENALRLARELQDKGLEANVINGLGLVHQSQREWNKAIKCFRDSREIFHHLGNEIEEAGILNNTGAIYQQTGQWEDALRYSERSLEISERLSHRPGEAAALANLARCHYHLDRGQHGDAIKLFERSLKIYEDLGYRAEWTDVMINLGVLYRDQGNLDRAVKCYQDSLEVKREIGDRYGQQEALRNMAFVYSKQAQWMKATDSCFESFQIAVQIHSSVVIDSLRCILLVSSNMLKACEFATPAQLARQLSELVQGAQVDDDEMRVVLAISRGVFTIIGFMAMCECDRESDAYREALELARSLDEKTGAALKLVEWLEEDD